MKNFFARLANRKHKGVDGLVVAIILVVIVVALMVLFKTTVTDKMSTQITNMGTQLDSLAGTP